MRSRGGINIVKNSKTGKFIVRRSPSGQAKASIKQKICQKIFTQAASFTKIPMGEELQEAIRMTQATPFVPRDVITKAVYGVLYQWTDTDGVSWQGVRQMAQDASPVLDSITDIPGSLLQRGATSWVGIAIPTTDGALFFDQATGFWVWKSSADALTALLSSILTSPGDLLSFDGTDALRVPIGIPGDVLTVASDGLSLEYDVGGGGGGGGYPPGDMPTIVQVAHDTSSSGVTFGATPAENNLLVAISFNPSDDTPASGWSLAFENQFGTDYGDVFVKVCGPSESTSQNCIASAPTSGGVVIWEIASTFHTSPSFVTALSANEATAQVSAPALLPCVQSCIALAALAPTSGTISQVLNGGTQDVLDNTGARPLAAGHADLSIAPMAGLIAIFNAAVASKPMTVLISS